MSSTSTSDLVIFFFDKKNSHSPFKKVKNKYDKPKHVGLSLKAHTPGQSFY
jgi:hypothetical protein